MTIAIETKIIGTPDYEDEVFDILIEDLPEYISLKDLIREKVKTEIETYNAKKNRDYGLEYRSLDELVKDIKRGEINIKKTLVKDIDGEVSKAINAFKEGRYKVFLNGNQIFKLEEKVPTNMDSKIMFLRLIPLTGG
jgi:hypothetical protein